MIKIIIANIIPLVLLPLYVTHIEDQQVGTVSAQNSYHHFTDNLGVRRNIMCLTSTEQIWIKVVHCVLCSSGFDNGQRIIAHIMTPLHVSKDLKHLSYTRCISRKLGHLQRQ